LYNPPTYIKTNDVTEFFQQIVNTYGIPNYQEANPAPFAIVTFPFFFGIMFGDYGHGSLIFFVGLILTLFSEKIKSTVFAPALAMRYVLLMMGACSMYNGLIYNEFFSIPNDWFGTCFELTKRESNKCVNCVYPPRVEAGKHFVWNGATTPAVKDP